MDEMKLRALLRVRIIAGMMIVVMTAGTTKDSNNDTGTAWSSPGIWCLEGPEGFGDFVGLREWFSGLLEKRVHRAFADLEGL